MEPLRASVTVETPPERAFELFTEGMGTWWPREFSWSQDKLEGISWERHGDGAQEYRDGFEQAGAWPYALERFAAAAAK
jgi:uncharacterized protein YndB with AHSA1/START domain